MKVKFLLQILVISGLFIFTFALNLCRPVTSPEFQTILVSAGFALLDFSDSE